MKKGNEEKIEVIARRRRTCPDMPMEETHRQEQLKGDKIKKEQLATILSGYSGKEQPWDINNSSYMGTTEAVDLAKYKGRKTSCPTITRMSTQNKFWRYMRKYNSKGKPTRTCVHIADFLENIDKLPPIEDAFSEEAVKRFSKIKAEKQKT